MPDETPKEPTRSTEEPKLIETSALEQISRAEIDIQITTARRYPRNLTQFLRDAESLACLDEDTAASMFYVLPRDGKRIEGPSVRLAEVVGSAWGNLHYASRVTEIGDKFVVAQGACWDLEKNVRVTTEVRRRITDKYGRRYSDDMINTTSNAATSIALRNSIFKVVPQVYARTLMEKAKQTAVGKSMSLQDRRRSALEYFVKIGAKIEDLLKVLDADSERAHKSEEDINLDDIIILRGFRTAISDGETTWAEIVKEAVGTDVPAPTKLDDLTKAATTSQPGGAAVAATPTPPTAQAGQPAPQAASSTPQVNLLAPPADSKAGKKP